MGQPEYEILGEDGEWYAEGEDYDDDDMLGDAEILGGTDDDDDDLDGDALDELLEGGARRRRSRPRRRRRMPSRPKVRASNPNLGVTLAGIPVTSIPIGATQTVNISIAEAFRADRLILEQNGLRVADIKIGTISQNISGQPIPQEAFAFNAINTKLRGNTAEPGVGIDITVTNPTGVPVDLAGVFIGPSVIARRR